jgi:hypothetical protein
VIDETTPERKLDADSALKSGHLQNSCAGHNRRGLLALSEAVRANLVDVGTSELFSIVIKHSDLKVMMLSPLVLELQMVLPIIISFRANPLWFRLPCMHVGCAHLAQGLAYFELSSLL